MSQIDSIDRKRSQVILDPRRESDLPPGGPRKLSVLRKVGLTVLSLASIGALINFAESRTNPAEQAAAKAAANTSPDGVHPQMFGLKVQDGDTPVNVRTKPYAFDEGNIVTQVSGGEQINGVPSQTYTDNNGNVWAGFAFKDSPTGSAWVDETTAGLAFSGDTQVNDVTAPLDERLIVKDGNYFLQIGQSTEPAPSATISSISN